jgi:hypothetical protein
MPYVWFYNAFSCRKACFRPQAALPVFQTFSIAIIGIILQAGYTAPERLKFNY